MLQIYAQINKHNLCHLRPKFIFAGKLTGFTLLQGINGGLPDTDDIEAALYQAKAPRKWDKKTMPCKNSGWNFPEEVSGSSTQALKSNSGASQTQVVEQPLPAEPQPLSEKSADADVPKAGIPQ